MKWMEEDRRYYPQNDKKQGDSCPVKEQSGGPLYGNEGIGEKCTY
jgi:hypothetical protein